MKGSCPNRPEWPGGGVGRGGDARAAVINILVLVIASA